MMKVFMGNNVDVIILMGRDDDACSMFVRAHLRRDPLRSNSYKSKVMKMHRLGILGQVGFCDW